MTALSRRHVLAGAAATVAAAALPAVAVKAISEVHEAIVVPLEETPLGATITDWAPGVPYVRGEVVRWGSRLYWCHESFAEASTLFGKDSYKTNYGYSERESA
jgi:hypothetical protein